MSTTDTEHGATNEVSVRQQRPLAPPGSWHRMRPIAVPVLAAFTAKFLVVVLTFLLLDRPDDFWHRLTLQWDGEHYLTIARDGYSQGSDGPGGSIAFAFGYPMIVRLLGGSEAAALLVNNSASLAAIGVVAWHWGSRPAIAVALFPPFLVYGTVAYSEGLFVLLAALGLALAERGREVMGGLAAGAATTVRYLGGPALLLALIPWRGLAGQRGWVAPAMVAIVGIGIVAFQWLWTGLPLGYYEAQRPWDAELAWPWQHFDWLLNGWFTLQGGPIGSGNLEPVDFVVRDILFSLPVVAGIVLLFRRPAALPSAVYSLVVFTTAISTVGTPAASLPRFLAAAFPAIAVLGDRLRDRWVWIGYTIVAVTVAVSGMAHHLFSFWS